MEKTNPNLQEEERLKKGRLETGLCNRLEGELRHLERILWGEVWPKLYTTTTTTEP